MTNKNDLVPKINPLPINYYTIFRALKSVFPDHAFFIMTAIKKIIVVNDEIPGFSTMGITKNGELLIHQRFWDEHMGDMDALKTVLMHEFMHFVLGDVFNLKTEEDTPDYKLENMADLIAMDARINSFICNSRPDINPSKFFLSFYNNEVCAQDFMHKLLRPSSFFDPNHKDEKRLKPFYDKFYSENFCQEHASLARVILEILKKNNKSNKSKGVTLKIKLVGSHGESGEEIDLSDLENVSKIEIDTSGLDNQQKKDIDKQAEKEKNSGTTPEEIPNQNPIEKLKKGIIEHIKKEASTLGAGKSKDLHSKLLSVALNITERLDVEKFKMLAFNSIFANFRSQAKKPVGTWSTSPVVPNKLATSDAIRETFDYPNLLFKKKKMQYTIDKNMLPIYLDVSGSTYSYLPEIIQLISNVSSKIDYVWGFSNYVVKHEIKDLSSGKINSSGGTDFDCIIDHATENKFKHIVVITDGEAYTKYSASTVPGLETVVTILFGYARRNNYFTQHYGNTHMIDEVKV